MESFGSLGKLETAELREKVAEETARFALPPDWREGRQERAAFAIDSEYTMHKDDAISLEANPDGSATVRVSIADVGSYLPGYPAMTALAQRYGWTLYRGKRVVSPMLPREISEDQLSLLDNQERPAITLHLPIDALGVVGTPQITHDVLTAHSMTYDEADALAASGQNEGQAPAIRDLEAIARRLYLARTGQAEASLTDEEGHHLRLLNSIGVGQLIVQESMIAANMAIARYLFEHDIPAIYRAYTLTDQQAAELASADITTREEKELMRYIARAQYSTAPAAHTALGLPVYTHFTSPLRRFVDFVNNVNVIAYLQDQPPRFGAEQIEYICGRFNRLESERRANSQTVPSALAGLEHIRAKQQRARHTGERVLSLLSKIDNNTAHAGDLAVLLFGQLEGDEEEIHDIREAAAQFVAERIHFGRSVLRVAAQKQLLSVHNFDAKPGGTTIIEDRDGQQFSYRRKASAEGDNISAIHTMARVAGVRVTTPTREELALQHAHQSLISMARRNGLASWTETTPQPDAGPEEKYKTVMGIRLGPKPQQRHERILTGPTKNGTERAAAAQLIIDLDLLNWTPEKEIKKAQQENPIVKLKAKADRLRLLLTYEYEQISTSPARFACTGRLAPSDGNERTATGEGQSKKAAQRAAAAALLASFNE